MYTRWVINNKFKYTKHLRTHTHKKKSDNNNKKSIFILNHQYIPREYDDACTYMYMYAISMHVDIYNRALSY